MIDIAIELGIRALILLVVFLVMMVIGFWPQNALGITAGVANGMVIVAIWDHRKAIAGFFNRSESEE